jgi:hypothetical protein
MQTYLKQLIQFFNGFDQKNTYRVKQMKISKNFQKNIIFTISNYFLIKRIIPEINFHHTYLLFTTGFSFYFFGFFDTLVKTCFEIYKIFLKKRKNFMSKHEIVIFESIGHFLGGILAINNKAMIKKYFSIHDSIFLNYNKNSIDSQTFFLTFFLRVTLKIKRVTNLCDYIKDLRWSLCEILGLSFCSKKIKMNIEIFNKFLTKKTFRKVLCYKDTTKFFNQKFCLKFLLTRKNYKCPGISRENVYQKKIKKKLNLLNKKKTLNIIPQKFILRTASDGWKNLEKTDKLLFMSFLYFSERNLTVNINFFEKFLNIVYFTYLYFFSNDFKIKKIKSYNSSFNIGTNFSTNKIFIYCLSSKITFNYEKCLRYIYIALNQLTFSKHKTNCSKEKFNSSYKSIFVENKNLNTKLVEKQHQKKILKNFSIFRPII